MVSCDWWTFSENETQVFSVFLVLRISKTKYPHGQKAANGLENNDTEKWFSETLFSGRVIRDLNISWWPDCATLEKASAHVHDILYLCLWGILINQGSSLDTTTDYSLDCTREIAEFLQVKNKDATSSHDWVTSYTIVVESRVIFKCSLIYFIFFWPVIAWEPEHVCHYQTTCKMVLYQSWGQLFFFLSPQLPICQRKAALSL